MSSEQWLSSLAEEGTPEKRRLKEKHPKDELSYEVEAIDKMRTTCVAKVDTIQFQLW